MPTVRVFEWEPGVNDREYIKKLREELTAQQKLTGKAIAKLKKYTAVVRCSECKHADQYYHCKLVNFYATADDYCSRGEKRDV